MNLGWYEIMDRIAMIQDQLEMNVAKHQEIDKEFYPNSRKTSRLNPRI